MKNRLIAVLISLTVSIFGAGRALADVSAVSISSPTTGDPVEVGAGSTLTVGISYSADNSGGSTVDFTLRVLISGTQVGQTNFTLAKQTPGGSFNLPYFLTNCTPNGIYTLQIEATETTSVTNTQTDAVYVISGKPTLFNVTGGGAYCSGGSGVVIGLSSSEFGVNYQLKRGALNSGSAVAGTGGAISFGNKLTPGIYTVVASDALSGCSSTMSGSATVSINAASVGGTATPADNALCSGSTTTISLAGQTGSIVEWQYSTNGGDTWTSIASTDNPLTTDPLTTSTYFQAVVVNGGCSAAFSSAASVTVNPPTVGGTATAGLPAVCNGSSTTITLTGQTGSIVKWQTSTNGTDWTDVPSTANPLNTGNLTGTRHYRAVVQSGLCSVENSTEAVVTVSPPTVGGSASATAGTICSGTATTITLSGQTGSIVRWESSLDGINWSPIASTGNPLNTGNLTNSTQFRAIVQSGSCNQVDSGAATVTVNPESVGGTATPLDSALCNGSSTTINLSGQVGVIVKWQTSTNGTDWTDIPSTASSLNTGNLTETRRYRAYVQSGLCSSSVSSEAIVTVSPATVGGTAAASAPTVCSGNGTTITLSGHTGSIVKWQSSQNGIDWSDIVSAANPLSTGNLTTTTQFRALVQSGGCTTLDSSAATVTVTPASVGGTATPGVSPLCSGSATVISLSGHTGTIVKWQVSTNGTDWSDIATSSNPLNTGTLTGTKHFRAVVQSGECSITNSTEAVVTINQAPSITGQPASAVKLVGDSVTFTVSASHAASYQWRSNGIALGGATSSSYTINSITSANAASYDCVVTGDSPCAATTSAAATLTVGSKLVFTSEPVNTVAGATLADVAVQIQDESGNGVPFTNGTISLSLNGGATLSGTVSVTTDVNGEATFSDLRIYKAGTGYTLTASGSNLTVATSSPFAVTVGAASAYRITATTATPNGGSADALTIKLVDQYTNTITAFTGDKSLTFSGLSTAANGTHPTITDKTGTSVNVGTATLIRFTSGQSSLGGSLIAYKAEGPVTLAATDGTLSTSTSGGSGAVLTVQNLAPTAGNDSASRSRNTQLRLRVSNLLTNDTDINGDNLTFVSVSSSSAQGATVVANATFVSYAMPSGTNPETDTFTYTVSDGLTTSTGTVTVTLLPDPTGGTQNIVAQTLDENNHPSVTFAGVPGYAYKIQRSANMSTWVDLLTTNAPAAGLFNFVDLSPSNPAFYRAINQ